jgi:hypothetical protein
MSDQETERPSFWGPLQAAWRQGLKEVGQYLLPAFPDSARPIEEPGTLGNPTPQMITEQLSRSEPMNSIAEHVDQQKSKEQYDQMLDRYAARGDRGENEQEMER